MSKKQHNNKNIPLTFLVLHFH